VRTSRLLTRDLALLLGLIAAMFLGVAMLLPVAPLVVEHETGLGGRAGVVTAVFFATTVAAQIAMPKLLRRRAVPALLTAGMVLLGAPAVLLAFGGGWGAISAAMAVRGAGFGIVTVAAFALVAASAPEGRRAEALGLSGLAVGIPNVFAPSLGLWLLDGAGRATVFALGGAPCLAGALLAPMLSRNVRLDARKGGVAEAMRSRALLLPFLALTTVTLAFGAILTFAPVALPEHGAGSAAVLLLCVGTCGFLARWLAGRAADRLGASLVVVPAFALAIAGLVLLAADRAPAMLVVAGLLFGAGLGAVQTGLQAMMFARAGSTSYDVASVLWNIGFDLGIGLGAVLFGLVAAGWGYPAMFWTLPFVCAAAFVIAAASRR
jgi:predicted MFS family arabinose efflux permease